MRFASFVHPHIGGTFTAYLRLREGLALQGIDALWLDVGESARRAFEAPQWAAFRPFGLPVPEAASPKELVGAVIDTVARENIDGVFVNVLTDPVLTSVARHLPERVVRVMIVHNITPGTYDAARAVRDHVHVTIGVSPRIRDDLVSGYGFDPYRTRWVANAPSPAPDRPRPGRTGAMKLLFVGRIEDASKGVFFLPRIMRELPPEITLTVAGDGPDLDRLRRACAPLGERVRFLGAVAPDAVADLCLRHDALVAPSRFEGYGMVIVEAMVCGCAPVVSRIRGVTDMIVRDGVDGALFDVGDAPAAAARIRELAGDAAKLEAMSAMARRVSERLGGAAEMGRDYAAAIRECGRLPLPAPPLSIDDWRLPRGLRRSLRSYLPASVKNILRTVRERTPIEDGAS